MNMVYSKERYQKSDFLDMSKNRRHRMALNKFRTRNELLYNEAIRHKVLKSKDPENFKSCIPL